MRAQELRRGGTDVGERRPGQPGSVDGLAGGSQLLAMLPVAQSLRRRRVDVGGYTSGYSSVARGGVGMNSLR